MLPIGVALDPVFDDASAFGGAVAACRAGCVAIELDELGIVHIGSESALYLRFGQGRCRWPLRLSCFGIQCKVK